MTWDQAEWNHYKYQAGVCAHLSDTDLILGIIASYRRPPCDAPHFEVIDGHLATDECRYFYYVSGTYIGMSDHWNMRWFKEWCEKHRPHILKKLCGLKVFW